MSMFVPVLAAAVTMVACVAPKGAAEFASSGGEHLARRDTVNAIPSSILEEHEAIRHDLDHATRQPGEVGVSARTLAALMEPHFVKEEELALPPLAILPALAADQVTPEMDRVASLAVQLEAELPTMIEEHRAIGAAVGKLAHAARAAGRPEIEAFAERILHHARTEEEVTYPAAIIVGRYVQGRLAR